MQNEAPDGPLLILSDHGFAGFDRAVHLNTCLMRQGFLTLDDPAATGDELFAHVDWSAPWPTPSGSTASTSTSKDAKPAAS